MRDFIYRNNDIIIVLLILALAAFIIYGRVTLIMEYPEKAAARALTETTQETQPDSETEQAAPAATQ